MTEPVYYYDRDQFIGLMNKMLAVLEAIKDSLERIEKRQCGIAQPLPNPLDNVMRQSIKL